MVLALNESADMSDSRYVKGVYSFLCKAGSMATGRWKKSTPEGLEFEVQDGNGKKRKGDS